MKEKKEELKCSICGMPIPEEEFGWSYGHNARPINDGRCCYSCNLHVVIPRRLYDSYNRKEN